MASLIQIRDGVKTTLEAAISGIKVYPTVESATVLPAVVVMPNDSDFLVAMGRGTDTWNLNLIVMVAPGVPEVAQRQLDGYITGAGNNSIRAALFNSTLGLVGTNAHVTGLVPGTYNGKFESAGVAHIGAMLGLVVHTPGTA